MRLPLTAQYSSLPDGFYAALAPTPVKEPSFIAVNDALAEVLQLNPADLRSSAGLDVLSGNAVAEGSTPLSMVYSGHQFGHWSGQLGDGRAILLGEAATKDGTVYDIQLKGAGRTPYSRGGDGRSALGPVIREYVMSEAMHALGVPTTRALAGVRTGEMVVREGLLPGGIFTRVARSHVRVGTFQHFAAQKNNDALSALVAFCIKRLDPSEAGLESPEAAAFLLRRTVERQAHLIATWMSLGFIHGVMNTDNMAISGETIDYGPCAFMDGFDPETVYSSIDRQGRYAYQNQAPIAHWNLACLASALLPLLSEDEDTAVSTAQEIVDGFGGLFKAAYLEAFRVKLGLKDPSEDDESLIAAVLGWMAQDLRDFTNTFRALSHNAIDMTQDDALKTLAQRWGEGGVLERRAAMLKVNPAYIPRNHQVEKAIRASVDEADDGPFHALNTVLSRPYETQDGAEIYAQPPLPNEIVHQTFCGT
ncbi:MAG: YdiU family protein [Pseudomonadota bacterium]